MTLLVTRLSCALLIVAGVVFGAKIQHEDLFDGVITFYESCFIVVMLYVASTRPVTYLWPVIIDFLAILTIYLLIPNRLSLQILGGISFTISDLVLIFFFKEGNSLLILNLIGAVFVMVNVLGILSSRQHHLARRTQFLAWLKQKELAEALQSALNRVKRLKDLLPICANCKKIRDDAGYWHEVEVYIHKHADTDFSHGIFPDCMTELYGEYFQG